MVLLHINNFIVSCVIGFLIARLTRERRIKSFIKNLEDIEESIIEIFGKI
jgi:uncharacterized membrane-anchored protein YhcB (DUF1043 family)